MLASPITFIIGGVERDALVGALSRLGYQFNAPRAEAFTLLDTFDGRLHRAGLRLILHATDGLELVLGGDDVVAAHLGTSSSPRFAADLAPGPFRSRLAGLTDIRALLPKVGFTSTTTSAICRDGNGRAVANVVLHEQIAFLEADSAAGRPLPPAVIEVHDVVGTRKPARRTVDALEELGLEPVDGDTLDVATRASGVDLDGFDDSPTVPLDATMPAVEGVRDVLANLADTIDANWQGTTEHLDPEFLHDLRVAVRRTRAVVSQTKAALPPDVVTDAREGFGWLGGLTGPARDLDVYLIEWNDYVRPLGASAVSALDPVRRILEQRQAAAHAELDNAMRSSAAADLMATWRRHLAELTTHQPQGDRAGRALGRLVRQRISKTQKNLVEHGRLIQPETPAEQVHDLRKDAKKLRYLLECFGSILPAAPRKQFVQRLKAFQDNLGEHQDAEVHVSLIREIASELHGDGVPAETMLAIGQLSERLEQIRIAARTEFAERFAEYDTKATQRALDATLDGLV